MVEIDGRKFQQSIIRDITDRKKAEAELTRQKNFIRQVIDSDPNLIFVKDAEGKFLLANEAMAKSYGLTTESIVGKYNWELTDDRELIEKYDRDNRKVIETRHKYDEQLWPRSSDGSAHILQTIRRPLVQEDGSISTLTIAMDITELKEAEEAAQT